jgi:hypothetical protein
LFILSRRVLLQFSGSGLSEENIHILTAEALGRSCSGVEWKNAFLPPQQQQLFCSISRISLCDIGKVEVSILRISQHRQKLEAHL